MCQFSAPLPPLQESVLSWSWYRVSVGLCVVIASRVAIHNKPAANWAEKTHSRVGKQTRTPHEGRI